MMLSASFLCVLAPGKSSGLEESTHGLVFLLCGGATTFTHADNFFSGERDALYFADGEKKALNSTQKPISFLQWLIKLFSRKDDWILDGLSGTGTFFIDRWTVV